jgi:hypothetical protein
MKIVINARFDVHNHRGTANDVLKLIMNLNGYTLH